MGEVLMDEVDDVLRWFRRQDLVENEPANPAHQP